MLRLSDIFNFIFKDDNENKKDNNRNEDEIPYYRKSLDFMDELLYRIKSRQTIDKNKLDMFLSDFIDHVLLYNDDLLRSLLNRRKEYKISEHIINLLILFISFGLWLGWKKKDLFTFSLGVLFCDICLVKFEELIYQNKIFSPREREIIKHHAFLGADLYKKIYSRDNELWQIITAHHQDIGENDLMGEYINVIQICDIFEALTHPRPYREAKTSYSALMELLEIKRKSAPLKMRVFLENFGVYPLTSRVRLNDNRLGIVVKLNKGYPLRPCIKIIDESSGGEYISGEIINLMEHRELWIEAVLTD